MSQGELGRLQWVALALQQAQRLLAPDDGELEWILAMFADAVFGDADTTADRLERICRQAWVAWAALAQRSHSALAQVLLDELADSPPRDVERATISQLGQAMERARLELAEADYVLAVLIEQLIGAASKITIELPEVADVLAPLRDRWEDLTDQTGCPIAHILFARLVGLADRLADRLPQPPQPATG